MKPTSPGQNTNRQPRVLATIALEKIKKLIGPITKVVAATLAPAFCSKPPVKTLGLRFATAMVVAADWLFPGLFEVKEPGSWGNFGSSPAWRRLVAKKVSRFVFLTPLLPVACSVVLLINLRARGNDIRMMLGILAGVALLWLSRKTGLRRVGLASLCGIALWCHAETTILGSMSDNSRSPAFFVPHRFRQAIVQVEEIATTASSGRFFVVGNCLSIAGRYLPIPVNREVIVYFGGSHRAPTNWLPGTFLTLPLALIGDRLYANPGTLPLYERSELRQSPLKLYCKSILLARLIRQPVLLPDPRAMWTQWQRELRSAISARLRLFTGDGWDQGLCMALILGRRHRLGADQIEDFRKSGTIHMIAISGLHVAILLLLMWTMLYPLPLPYRYKIALLGILSWIYPFILGNIPGVWRATVMANLWIVSRFKLRYPHPLQILAAAMIGYLVIAPWEALEVGFQLSFAATALLIMRYPAIRSRLKESNGFEHGWRLKLVNIGTTLWISFFWLTPLTWIAFHRFVPLAAICSMLLFPPIAGLYLIGALAVVVPPALFKFLAPILVHVGSFFANFITGLCSITADLPISSLILPYPPWPVLAFYVACLLTAELYMHRAALALPFAFLTCGWLALAIAYPKLTTNAKPGHSRMMLIDVGQGESILLQNSSGGAILYDGGGDYSGSPRVGERVVLPFLRNLGIFRLDAVFLSHAHPDHAAGLKPILEQMEVGVFYYAGPQQRRFWVGDLIDICKRRNIPTRPLVLGNRLLWGNAEIDIVHPSENIRWSLNDGSLTFICRFPEGRVLIPGDLEKRGELAVSKRLVEQVDILVAAHHGSKTSSSRVFLEACRPQWVMVSAGRGNRFGFPHRQVVDRIRSLGIDIATTNAEGLLVVDFRSNNLSVSRPIHQQWPRPFLRKPRQWRFAAD